MMIARKLLAACALHGPSTQTALLSTWASAAPEVGDLLSLRGSVSGGTLTVPAGFGVHTSLAPTIQAATGDWLLEFFCYGSTPPIVFDGASSVSVYQGGMQVGGQSALVPPLLAGANHFAVGVQAGVVQAWVNGARIVNGGAMQPSPSQIDLYGSGTGVFSTSPAMYDDVRICYGVDLYGDSATITVPTLPLGIV